MLPSKIKLTDKIINEIKAARTAKRIPAATLSRIIKRDDSYISSLELKRLRTISANDLVTIFCVLLDVNEHEVVTRVEAMLNTDDIADNYAIQGLSNATHSERPGTIMVSEPLADNKWYDLSSEFTDTELISDMLQAIIDLITEYYKKDPKETVFALSSFVKTLKFDPAFTLEIMGTPFYTLRNLRVIDRKKVLAEIREVLKKNAVRTSLSDALHTDD